MPVARKPKPKSVEEFIQEGGSESQAAAAPTANTAAPAAPKDVPDLQKVTLRIPGDLLADMDAAIANRRPKPSRNNWILEAIVEKLEQQLD